MKCLSLLKHNFVLVFTLSIGCLISPLLLMAQEDHVPGQIIVQLEKGHHPKRLIETQNQMGLSIDMQVEKCLSARLNIWLLSFDHLSADEEEVLLGTARSEMVKVAQYNHSLVQQRDTTPDDANFNEQWDMYNDGTNGSPVAGDADISARDAWSIETGGFTASGDRIVVAVIDGGFDIDHEDLSYFVNEQEVPGNGLDDDGNGYVDDVNGWNAYSSSGNITSDNHGTHVAGTVGAIGNNEIGVAGVNWDVDVMAIQGSSGFESTVIEAYGYALEMRARYNESDGEVGAFVVSTNSSFGVDFGDPADYPIWCAFYDSLGAYGILSCGATINSNQNIDIIGDVPTACASDWLISVTNTNSQDTRNSAGFGLTTIDLAAPGTGIWSTLPNDAYGGSFWSGTSMATPHVAGAIALMYAAACETLIEDYKEDPAGVALVIKEYLMTMGVDSVAGLTNEVVSGGRLNLHTALLSLEQYSCSPISLSATTVDATCGNEDGEATVMVMGNEGPVVSYQWNDPYQQTTPTADSLMAGTYEVVVTDSAGNVNSLIVTIVNSNEPDLNILGTNLDCFGDSTGSAELQIIGGTSPFEVLWTPTGDTTLSIDGLMAGEYSVSVMDSADCVVETMVTITEPPKIEVAAGIFANTAEPSNGRINLNVAGGTPDYAFDWQGPEGFTSDEEDLSDLFQGDYDLVLTDENGCTFEASYLVPGSVGLAENDGSDLLTIQPNPNNGVFSISLNQPGVYAVSVWNTLGQLIFEQELTAENGTPKEFVLPGEYEGIFLLRLNRKGEQNKPSFYKILVKNE